MKLVMVSLLFCVVLANGSIFQPIYDYIYPSNQVYIEEKAINLFYYTKVATCDVNVRDQGDDFRKQIKEWNCGFFCDQHPGMRDLVVVHNTTHEGQAYVGYNPSENRIVASNRDTQNLYNFIEDVKFFHTQFGCDDCQVHTGFLNTYKDVRGPIVAQVKLLKEKYPFATVTLVGHSLGGAATMFLALDLSEQGVQVDEIYTFGYEQNMSCIWQFSATGQRCFREVLPSNREPQRGIPHGAL